MRKPVLLTLALFGALAAGWGAIAVYLTWQPRASDPRALPTRSRSAAIPKLEYVPQSIGAPVSGSVRPLVTHIQIVDLDRDGFADILYCEGQKNSVRWLRQSPRGVFTESVIGEEIPGPVHVCAADVNGTGRLDVLVASMGKILPTTERIGAVVVLENLDNLHFKKRVLVDHVARVTDMRAADLLGHRDGRLDLVVGQFGYDQGETRWMENKGGWEFESHVVNTQSGCINTPVADFDGDGRIDMAALISQEWEEVHLIRNLGNGQFADGVIWGSTNEDFGSSGMTVADINRDGRPDLVFTNGDALDYGGAGTRPWHGVQWLENKGDGFFKYHRIANMAGAFSPVVVDLNGDDALDLLVVSAFADWDKPDAVSLMGWINEGQGNFTPVVLARAPTHLITVAAGDLDGTGVPVIVTGGFHVFPPFEKMSSLTLWRRK